MADEDKWCPACRRTEQQYREETGDRYPIRYIDSDTGLCRRCSTDEYAVMERLLDCLGIGDRNKLPLFKDGEAQREEASKVLRQAIRLVVRDTVKVS
jgi:hypothetical protein